MSYRKKRIPTVTLERQLLKSLMTSKVELQGRLSSCKEKWFTSDERFLLFDFVRGSYSTNRNCMSETQFNYLLDTRLGRQDDEQLREKLLAEYQVVMSVQIEDEMEAVVARLNEALAGSELEDLLKKAVEKNEAGDITDAYQTLKQGLLTINPQAEDEDEITPLWGNDSQWKRNVIDVKEHPELYAGIKTGFSKYDELTGGLYPGELYMVFGLSGKGKSSLMKQIELNVSNQSKNVLHCANEENKQQILSKFISNETRTNYRGWKTGTYSEEDMERYEAVNDKKKNGKKGNIYVYTFKQQTDASCISRKLAELKSKGITIDLVVVDYLDLMSSIVRAYNENDEGGRIAGDLKQISLDFDVPVLTCTQANTSAEKQETKDRPFLSMEDMFGTKRKIHSSNVVIGIVNQTATVGAGEREEEVTRHKLVICVPKNRDGGVFTFKLVFEVKTGYIHDDDGEFDPVSEEQEQYAKNLLREAGGIPENLSPEKKAAAETERAHKILHDIYSEQEKAIAKDELAVKRSRQSYKPEPGEFFSEDEIRQMDEDNSRGSEDKDEDLEAEDYRALVAKIRGKKK